MQITELTKGWSEDEIRDFGQYAARFAENARDLAERLRRGEIPPLPSREQS